MNARPQGSNADEWAVFLSEHEGPDSRSYAIGRHASSIATDVISTVFAKARAKETAPAQPLSSGERT